MTPGCSYSSGVWRPVTRLLFRGYIVPSFHRGISTRGAFIYTCFYSLLMLNKFSSHYYNYNIDLWFSFNSRLLTNSWLRCHGTSQTSEQKEKCVYIDIKTHCTVYWTKVYKNCTYSPFLSLLSCCWVALSSYEKLYVLCCRNHLPVAQYTNEAPPSTTSPRWVLLAHVHMPVITKLSIFVQ